MGFTLIALAFFFTGSFFFAVFTKKEPRIVINALPFFVAVVIFLSCYREVGVPVGINNAIYSPFKEGTIFQKYWSTEKDGKYFFSVIKITEAKRDTLKEVSVVDIKYFPVVKKETENYFIYLNNDFWSITEEQKNHILKLDSTDKIKGFLNWN
jgi:hypothetical protein